MRSKQLGQLLSENGDVQADAVAQALKLQEQQGGLLGVILRNNGQCGENAIAQALLKQVQVTDVRCEELAVDPAVAALISREMCETEKLCPFERLGNLLCIVMGNPLNRRAITQIEEHTHLKVKSFKCVWPKIHELIQRTYQEDGAPAGGGEVLAMEAPAEQAPAYEEPALELNDPAAGEPAAPLEIPVDEPVLASAPAVPAVRRKPAPAEPAVVGIDALDESHAEVIEVNRRGLRKNTAEPAVADLPRPKAEKKAKVNVDLDTLDLSEGEVVRSAEEEEGLEELAHAAPVANKPLAKHAGQVVALKAVEDAYFYAGGNAPARRAAKLDDLLDGLPVAETVAQSIGEYEAGQAAKQVLRKAAPANRPLELQAAPAGSMTATLISEQEFQRLTASMKEDPVGEWDWQFAAAGPLAVQAYEEN